MQLVKNDGNNKSYNEISNEYDLENTCIFEDSIYF